MLDARASRGDIHHHGHRGTQKALHDRLRRIEQTARSVELNDQALRALRLCFCNAARNVTRGRGTNRAIDFNQRHLFRSRGRGTKEKKSQSAERGPHFNRAGHDLTD